MKTNRTLPLRRLLLACRGFAGLRSLVFAASISFLLLPQFQLNARVDQVVDHLIPVNEDELPAYQAELQSKLLITPADIARMIVRPAWQPEFAVSVYSTPPASADDVTKYKVTVTRASSNIWFAREPVQTIRRDAELTASVALLVKEVWKQTLVAARGYDSEVDSAVDGAIVEFALLEPNQSTLRGELPINPASDILSLENLGTLLVNYSQAATDEQNVLGREIEKTAKSLLKRKPREHLVNLKNSLRILPDERQVLKRKAKMGDPKAADRLSLYYDIYRGDRKMAVHYLKLGARSDSDVAVRKLMTMYSTDADWFDFGKALGFRQQLKRIAETQKISLKSDADWGYDRYLDHWRAGDKWRGRIFLKYAARQGSEKARSELIEIYSKDPDLRNSKKARYWKQRSRALESMESTTGTLGLISNATKRSPRAVAPGSAAQFIPVRILGKEGMIVPEVYLRESGLPAQGFWTPKRSQLEEVERSLPTFLRTEMQSRPLVELSEVIALVPKYRRQYVGMILEGKKVIWINCIPQKSEKGADPFANWNREIVNVSDGGSSFWGAVYDVAKRSFERLILNGSG